MNLEKVGLGRERAPSRPNPNFRTRTLNPTSFSSYSGMPLGGWIVDARLTAFVTIPPKRFSPAPAMPPANPFAAGPPGNAFALPDRPTPPAAPAIPTVKTS